MSANVAAYREHLEALARRASEWGTPEEIAALQWALSHVPASREIVRHVKRGTEYEVLGEAEVQVSTHCVALPGSTIIREARAGYGGDHLTVYRCLKTGKLWCRRPDEFRDGRFEPATPSPIPQAPSV